MRVLDLFCGAGGAATGYHRAGFEVVGVDIRKQPRYPFEFHQADALTYPLDDFDAVHASPPCQQYTQARPIRGREHPDLLPVVRRRLVTSGLPYVIENVPGAPMRADFVLAGSMFGLPSRRARWFEVNWPYAPWVWGPSDPSTLGVERFPYVYGHSSKRDGSSAERRRAMGVDWMTNAEIAQAIPPAFTEFIGRQLAALLR